MLLLLMLLIPAGQPATSNPGCQPVCKPVCQPACQSAAPPAKTLMASRDNGQTWQDIGASLPKNMRPFTIWSLGGLIYLGSPDGVYTSEPTCGDSGRFWIKATLDKRNIGGIYEGRYGPYAVSMEDGFYQRHLDIWTPMHTTLPDRQIYVVSESQGSLLVGCASGIYRSDNGAKSWSHVFEKGGVDAIHEHDGVLFTPSSHSIWRSANNGMTWESYRNLALVTVFLGWILSRAPERQTNFRRPFRP